MQNQLREFFDKVIGLEILQWCDIFIFVFIFDNISDYVVSDEDSEVGDKKSDIWCFISVQFDEVCLSSSLGSEVDIDDLEEFWFFFFILQFMGVGEIQFYLEDFEIFEGLFVYDLNSLWSFFALFDLLVMFDVEDYICMVVYGRDFFLSYFDYDSY